MPTPTRVGAPTPVGEALRWRFEVMIGHVCGSRSTLGLGLLKKLVRVGPYADDRLNHHLLSHGSSLTWTVPNHDDRFFTALAPSSLLDEPLDVPVAGPEPRR